MRTAPPTLDAATRVEWEMWVGRRVWARCGVIGIVTAVCRKPLNDGDYSLDAAVSAECRRRQDMEGRHWWAKVEWDTPDGASQGDLRDLHWLRSVDRNLDCHPASSRRPVSGQ